MSRATVTLFRIVAAIERIEGIVMNTATVSALIDGLCPTSPVEDFQSARDMVRVLKEYAESSKKRIDECTLEWIESNGQDMTIGTVRYYRGTKSTTKCVDSKNTLNAMLGITDVDTIASCLSSNAWKYGTCRTVLGDLYATHFITTEDVEIKEGKPVKSLQSINSRYVR